MNAKLGISMMRLSIAFLLALVPLYGDASSECESAKANAICDKKSVYDKWVCLMNSQGAIQQRCLQDATLENEYEQKLQDLHDLINSKFGDASSIEKQELSRIKLAIDKALEIKREYFYTIKDYQTRFIAFSKNIKDVYMPTLQDYQDELARLVEEGREAGTSSKAVSVIGDIQHLQKNEVSAIHAKRSELNILVYEGRILHNNYVREVSQLNTIVELNDMDISHSVDPQVADAIERYLVERLQLVNQATSGVIDSLKEKKQNLVSHEFGVEVTDALQTSEMLEMRRQYFNEVSDVVRVLKENSPSTFGNIPFQSEKWDAANALLGIVQFCESAGDETWQSLGCHTALQNEVSASRAVNSTIPSAIRFGLRMLSSDQSVNSDLLAITEKELNEGNVGAAAQYFDMLLDQQGDE